jgi:hypothetical protein
MTTIFTSIIPCPIPKAMPSHAAADSTGANNATLQMVKKNRHLPMLWDRGDSCDFFNRHESQIFLTV